MADAVDNF